MSKVVNKPKVLIFLTASFPYGNGETFIENEIKYLADKFDKVVIVSKSKSKNKTRVLPDNVVVYPNNPSNNKILSFIQFFSKVIIRELFNWKRLNIPFQLVNLRYLLVSVYKAKQTVKFIERLIESENIPLSDSICYSYWWLDEAIGLAYLKQKHPKITTITRCHGYDIYFERAEGSYLPLKQFCIDNLDGIFSISDNAVEYINRKFKTNNNIYLSRLGVTRNELELPSTKKNNTFVLVSCSLIYPNKRVHLILEALSILKINITWIHFGSFMENFSEKYFQSLNDEIKKVSPNIKIELKGTIPNSKVLEYYKNNAVDLFINVSESEGIPVSIMEAYSFGIPAIATAVGGTPEIVDDTNGYLLPENPTPQEVTNKIEVYYNLSVEEKNKKRKVAYTTWKEKYNAEKNYTNFVNDLLKL